MKTYTCPSCNATLEVDHSSDNVMKFLKRKLQWTYCTLGVLLAFTFILSIYTLSLTGRGNKNLHTSTQQNQTPQGDSPHSPPAFTPSIVGALALKLEGEDLKNVIGSGGAAHQQAMRNFGNHWSGNRQLWWTSAKPGDSLKIALSVPKAGTYRVQAQFTKAADYGIFNLYLNDQKIKESIDYYNILVDVTGVVDLGLHNLREGDNELKAVITGANPKAIKRHMFGLDYIELIPQE